MAQEIKVNAYVYLQSPDGSIWQVTVNNAGILVQAKVGTAPTI